MRYGRRFFGRRRFGRRFRGRRRPNAARAVSRITLAPRQQYLKLKGTAQLNGYLASLTTSNTEVFLVSLCNIGEWIDPLNNNLLPWPESSDPVADKWYGTWTPLLLGYTAYSQLFQEYVLNGVKLSITAVCTQPSSYTTAANANPGVITTLACPATINVQRSYAPFDLSDLPGGSELAAMPFGKSWQIAPNGRITDKVYVNAIVCGALV